MRRLFPLVCCAALFVAACGGGSDPVLPVDNAVPPALTASITPAAQPVLAPNTAVVVQFSAPVATASLQVTGTFTALNPVTSWSTDNATLTIAPPAGGWPRGQGGKLSVLATGAAGGAMASAVTADFFVPLQFTSGQAALAAIGQPDLAASTFPAAATARTVGSPQGNVAVAPDGRLFVGDYVGNRILAFSTIPGASDAAADLVLGQPDFTTSSFGATAQGAYSRPFQVAIGAGRMAAVDLNNSRVLIWSTIPTTNNALPDVVLGQADFTSSGTGCSATRMNFPEAVAITDDGKLLVADTGNHRVLVWSAIPSTHGAAADVVIGQSVFNTCRRNDDDQDNVFDATPSARTLWRPTGLWSDGQRLVVLDGSNHRALLWNTFPAANFAPAQVVLGQANFTNSMRNDDDQDGTDDFAATARTLSNPGLGVDSNGVQLAIADTNNHRVLVWNAFPTSNFQPADAVLGQPDLTSSAPGTAADRMNGPAGVTFFRDKVLVSDRDNHRILVLQSP